MSNKAFAVYHRNFDSIFIYIASSRGKAHAAAFNGCKEAGYNPEWKEFQVKRARQFDNLAKPGRYAAGWTQRNYDLAGNFCGYEAWGCLDAQEFKRDPGVIYKTLSRANCS